MEWTYTPIIVQNLIGLWILLNGRIPFVTSSSLTAGQARRIGVVLAGVMPLVSIITLLLSQSPDLYEWLLVNLRLDLVLVLLATLEALWMGRRALSSAPTPSRVIESVKEKR